MLLSRPFILLGKQSQRQREQMNDFSIRFESHSQQAWIQPFQMHQQHKQHNQLLTLIQYELQIGIESKKHVVTDRFIYDIFVGGFWPYSDRDEQGTYGHSLMHVIIPTTVACTSETELYPSCLITSYETTFTFDLSPTRSILVGPSKSTFDYHWMWTGQRETKNLPRSLLEQPGWKYLLQSNESWIQKLPSL